MGDLKKWYFTLFVLALFLLVIISTKEVNSSSQIVDDYQVLLRFEKPNYWKYYYYDNPAKLFVRLINKTTGQDVTGLPIYLTIEGPVNISFVGNTTSGDFTVSIPINETNYILGNKNYTHSIEVRDFEGDVVASNSTQTYISLANISFSVWFERPEYFRVADVVSKLRISAKNTTTGQGIFDWPIYLKINIFNNPVVNYGLVETTDISGDITAFIPINDSNYNAGSGYYYHTVELFDNNGNFVARNQTFRAYIDKNNYNTTGWHVHMATDVKYYNADGDVVRLFLRIMYGNSTIVTYQEPAYLDIINTNCCLCNKVYVGAFAQQNDGWWVIDVPVNKNTYSQGQGNYNHYMTVDNIITNGPTTFGPLSAYINVLGNIAGCGTGGGGSPFVRKMVTELTTL